MADRPLISGKQALIQEFLMADPLNAFHRRKTASINLAAATFCKKRRTPVRETMDERSRKLQKGGSGQRVRERWNKEQITDPGKNTGSVGKEMDPLPIRSILGQSVRLW